MKRYIVRLDRRAALREEVVGGKGASLTRLQRQGFRIPSGFVITTRLFQDVLANLGLDGPDQKGGWSPEDFAHLRSLLLTGPVPDHLIRDIRRAYRTLGGPVAVRSSMEGEDTATTSFAGQLDTFLNVRDEDTLLKAVRRCWASAFNERLRRYVIEQDRQSPTSAYPSMAVVVQRMVDAEAAGVAFSADPITGQPHVVIEGSTGLGEAVVQGLVEPQRYIIDHRDDLVEIPSSTTNRALLEEQHLIRLADLVRQVAEEAGAPQDIEWAWDGTGFYLLQSRPITSLAGKRIYSNSMIAEMLPGLIKPLTWSVSTTSKLETVLGRIFTELIGPNDVDFKRLARRIHSRAYADVTLLGQLLESMGLPPNFFEAMSRSEKARKRQRLPLSWKTIRMMARLGRFLWRYARIDGEIMSFIERHRAALAPFRGTDWSDHPPARLLAQAEKMLALYSETLWVNFIGPLNMMMRNRLLGHLVEKWAPEVEPSDLVRGLVGLKSLESDRELQQLAAQAAALPCHLQALLTQEDDPTIRAQLSTSEKGQAVIEAMDAFLERYGFLSANGTDISRKSWAENPTLIWQALGRAAASSRAAPQKNNARIRRTAHQNVLANLNALQRFLFNRVLTSTVTYIRLREETSFLISEDAYEMRRIFLALSERLIANGIFHQRDDIFYLTLDEVRQLVGGQLDADEACARITQQRAAMAADAQLELPPTIYGDDIAITNLATRDKRRTYLSGIVGSSGKVQGRACIVCDPAEASLDLTHDNILVVPFTDVSWTPLFPSVGGVVAETGGQLSHSAIIAREYGLPAVVNVKNATRLIKDGQTITVDGHRGRVYLE
jgi:pyruvate,water dikinase